MEGSKKKVLTVSIVIFAILWVGGLFAFTLYMNSTSPVATTETTIEGTVINENTLIIIFSHAGDDGDHFANERRVLIQDSIKPGDIPLYVDREQLIIVSCQNPRLLADGESALRSMGYTNVERGTVN